MKTVLFSDAQLANQQIFHLMNQIFTHENLKLEAAYDTSSTLAKANAIKPDVILLKGTADTLKAVKNADAVKHIPVIMMLPAKSSKNYIQRMLDNGASAVIDMGTTSILQVIDKINEVLG